MNQVKVFLLIVITLDTLSIGSAYVMRFRPNIENKSVNSKIFYDVLLPVGTLAVNARSL